jgi:hypothetical protein
MRYRGTQFEFQKVHLTELNTDFLQSLITEVTYVHPSSLTHMHRQDLIESAWSSTILGVPLPG